MKLICQESSDLELLSACLQDSLTCLKDMIYQAKERRFVLMASRYMWEDPVLADGGGRRVRCGVHFNDVTAVQVQGIDQTDRDGLLDLLAVSPDPQNSAEKTGVGDGLLTLHLLFAAHGSIKLTVECIDIVLSDQGQPWSTPHRQDHA